MNPGTYTSIANALMDQTQTYADISKRLGVWPSQVGEIYKELRNQGVKLPDRHRGKKGSLGYLPLHERIECRMKLEFTALRAKAPGRQLPFKLSDFYPIPTHCPVLGFPLDFMTHDSSLVFDFIDRSAGFRFDNIVLVSPRAKKLRGSASPKESVQLAKFFWPKYLEVQRNGHPCVEHGHAASSGQSNRQTSTTGGS